MKLSVLSAASVLIVQIVANEHLTRSGPPRVLQLHEELIRVELPAIEQ
jgi:hypothetical protein